MAELSPHSAGPASLLPEVRLEVRQGSARPLLYEVTDVAFLIGSVSGCDLRVPGADLPPVICMIMRRCGSVAIRRLAPTQPLHVNGQPLSSHSLSDGDRITVGTLELIVHAHFPVAPEATQSNKTSDECTQSSTLVNSTADLDARQRQTGRAGAKAGVRARCLARAPPGDRARATSAPRASTRFCGCQRQAPYARRGSTAGPRSRRASATRAANTERPVRQPAPRGGPGPPRAGWRAPGPPRSLPRATRPPCWPSGGGESRRTESPGAETADRR